MNITKEQFMKLYTTKLNLEEISKKHLDKHVYDALEIEPSISNASFVHVASFNYFLEDQKGNKKDNSKENIKYLNNYDQMLKDGVPLDATYVILGVNTGAKGKGHTFKPMEMFQNQSISKCINRYHNSLKKYGDITIYNDYLNGLYATDFIKGMPTAGIAGIAKRFNKIIREQNLDKDQFWIDFSNFFAEVLEKELSIFDNQTKVLIIMGGPKNSETYIINKFLKLSGLDKKYEIINIYHYSGQSTENKVIARHLEKVLPTIKHKRLKK